jgi:hypothetical protein
MPGLEMFFDQLSQRRRRSLGPLIDEYARLQAIQQNTAEAWPQLLATVQAYERRCAAAPILDDAPFFSPLYAREWSNAFLATLGEWQNETRDYGSAVDKFNNGRATLEAIEPSIRRLIASHDGSAIEVLMKLAQRNDFMPDAHDLGQMEADRQIVHLAQVYFARYSAEMSDAPARRAEPGRPRPDMQTYWRRKRLRETLMQPQSGKPGDFRLGNATPYVFYLDLNEAPAWLKEARGMYEDQALLMPGLPEADAFFARIEAHHNGLRNGFDRLTEEQTTWIDVGDRDELRDLRAELDLLRQRVMPSLSIMNTLRGFAYAGEQDARQMVLSLLAPRLAPDAHPEGAILADWSPVRAAFHEESARIAAIKPQAPSPEDLAQKAAAEREAAAAHIADLRDRLAQLEAEESATMTPGDLARRAANEASRQRRAARRMQQAPQRKAESAAQRAAREIAERRQRNAELASSRKAMTTRKQATRARHSADEAQRQQRARDREEAEERARREAERAAEQNARAGAKPKLPPKKKTPRAKTPEQIRILEMRRLEYEILRLQRREARLGRPLKPRVRRHPSGTPEQDR